MVAGISGDNISHLACAIGVSLAAGGCGAACGAVVDLSVELSSTIQRHVQRCIQTSPQGPQVTDDKAAHNTPAAECIRARLGDLRESVEGSDIDLPSRFAAQVESRPDDVALVAECEDLSLKCSLTFKELREKVLALAEHLRSYDTTGARGSDLSPGQLLVAVCLRRSPAMVISLLAVLEVGAAYVPLEPSHPEERRQYVLEDSGAGLIILEAQSDWTGGFSEHHCVRLGWPTGEVLSKRAEQGCSFPKPGGACYLLFTSGTTGQPKGVLVPRSGVVNQLSFFDHELRADRSQEDTFVAVATYCFDISVLEIFWPLCYGFRLALASARTAQSGHHLARFLDEQKATIFQATPASYRMLFKAGWTGRAGLKVLIGGEPFPARLAQALPACVDRVVNCYGPTETTMWATTYTLKEGPQPSSIPIGRALFGYALLISETESPEVEDAGELIIGGDGVTYGYNRRPELTAQQFVTLPFVEGWGSNKRVYKTGDLVRQLPGSKDFVCLGRIDCQVKIRGFRIELGEVEATLERHPAVAAAVAETVTDEAEEKWLVAFVQLKPGNVSSDELEEDLKKFLSTTLPYYMVPRRIAFLDTFPLAPTGKVNRKLLRQQAPDLREGAQPVTEEGVELDSLGIAKVKLSLYASEDRWLCNMQAFWMVVVLMGHLRPMYGADYHSADTSLRIVMSLGHGKSMTAFALMLGIKDSRDGPELRGRDVFLLGFALALTTFLAPILAFSFWPTSKCPFQNCDRMIMHQEWFLYAYFIGRSALALLSRLQVPPVFQVILTMSCAALVPETALIAMVGQNAMDNLFSWNINNGLRFPFVHIPAFYVMSYHCARPVLDMIKVLNQKRNGRLPFTITCFCWSAFAMLCVLTARMVYQYGDDPWGQNLWPGRPMSAEYPAISAVYLGAYPVSWDYMNSGGLGVYLVVYAMEVAAWVYGVALTAFAIALWPFELTTLGSTVFGTLVIHIYQSGAVWQMALYAFVVPRITDPDRDNRLNVTVLLIWSVAFCVGFMLLIGAPFYYLLARVNRLAHMLYERCVGLWNERCYLRGVKEQDLLELVGLLEEDRQAAHSQV